MLASGTILQNRYRIVRPIRQGGMGSVYQGLDERLGNTVALKQTLFTDDLLRKAFEQEARLLANLHHPALPVVSDHFVEGDGQFLVMQFIPGEDLADLLKHQHGPFALSQVLRWADQLLDALDYLHTQQPPVIHRDIKPQNLKLTPRGDIILLDFGLAKSTSAEKSRLTAGHSIAGYTLEYAPLEQILGEGTDPRSDLYALGATLYYLLTAAIPLNARARATALLDEQPDPLRPANEMNESVPPAVAAALHAAMALRPDRRPSSAAAMRSALHEALVASELAASPGPAASHRAGAVAPPERLKNGRRADPGPAAVSRVLATVLFTDIVDSTKRAKVLGDRVWRHLLEAHDALVRQELARYRGQEIKTTGDGFVAMFMRPAQAIHCACAIREAVRHLGIEIRAGLHTGECEIRPDDVAGIAVHFAARVLSEARASEILVSRTVSDAVDGTPLEFDERGAHELKGFPGAHQLFAVRPDCADAHAPSASPVPAAVVPARASASQPGAQAGLEPRVPTGDQPEERSRGHQRKLALGAGLVTLAIAALALVQTLFGPTRGPSSISTSAPLSAPLSAPAALATPPPAPGTLLYEADWSRGLAGWVGSGDWKTSNGMLVNDGPRERSIILAPYRPETLDYSVETEIQRTGDSTGHVSFAILMRGELRRGYWAGVHVGTGRTPTVGLDVEPPEGHYRLAGRYFDPGYEWHRYRVDVKGNNIRLFVDGTSVLDATDTSYRSSVETGLWSWGTQINVRSFRIIAL